MVLKFAHAESWVGLMQEIMQAQNMEQGKDFMVFNLWPLD